MRVLTDLDGSSLDLLGAGIDNLALLPHLQAVARVRVVVDDPGAIDPDVRRTLDRNGVEVLATAGWERSETVIRSPGFPRYRPDVVRQLGTTADPTVTTAINLWLGTFGDRYPTVLVTGTKGKSSVAHMLSAVLSSCELVGNIGTPIWSIVPPEPGVAIVCEISSYQAVDMDHSFDLGALTSLSEDHISWHGSVARYHADKLAPLLASHRVLTVDPLADRVGVHSNHRLVPVPSTNPVFSGLAAHMATNADLAIAAAQWLAEDFESVAVVPDPAPTLAGLPALVGRLRELRSSVDSHRWFDDSLASNPSGAAAAVTAFAGDHLWLILGGLDRGVSLQPLVAALDAVTGSVSVVAVPDNGVDLIRRLEAAGLRFAQKHEATDVRAAVAVVRERAEHPATVLFSPAAPTPPQHGNWFTRSTAFESAVAGP